MLESGDNWLLTVKLRSLVEELKAADEAAATEIWERADAALAAADAEEDAELAIPVWDRDLVAVEQVLAAWDDGSHPLPEWDKAVLKRAFKAYKKRLKLVRLDDVSTSGGNPLSQGRESTILGVRPPEQYPTEAWEILVRQGKLRDGGGGLLELPTD